MANETKKEVERIAGIILLVIGLPTSIFSVILLIGINIPSITGVYVLRVVIGVVLCVIGLGLLLDYYYYYKFFIPMKNHRDGSKQNQ